MKTAPPSGRAVFSVFSYFLILLRSGISAWCARTVAVENWSFYDVFLPLKQEYNQSWQTNGVSTVAGTNDTKFEVLPNKLLTEKSELQMISTLPDTMRGVDIDSYFDFGDNKCGSCDVEYYNSNLDVAYVSIEISDFNKNVGVLAYTNTGNARRSTKYTNFFKPLILAIDPSQASEISELKSQILNGSSKFQMRIASPTRTPTPNVNYGGVDTVVNIFDCVTIDYDSSNRKYIAKHDSGTV